LKEEEQRAAPVVMNKEFIDLHYPKAEVVIVEERSNFASFMDKLESEEIVTP